MFCTLSTYRVFSDGRFIEIANELPEAIVKLNDLYTHKLSKDEIEQSIPKYINQTGERVLSKENVADNYVLSSKSNQVVVDSTYYDYLFMRYPNATVYTTGKLKPVVFWIDNIVRGVLMPIDKESKLG